MNCGTFELQRIACAVAEVMTAHGANKCASCGTPLNERAGYHCQHCGAVVCVLCGCTDERACEAGCSWIEPGICSTHREELNAAFARFGVRMSGGYV